MANISCHWCRRLISWKDIDEGRAVHQFVPDSAWSHEQSYWVCPRCIEEGAEVT